MQESPCQNFTFAPQAVCTTNTAVHPAYAQKVSDYSTKRSQKGLQLLRRKVNKHSSKSSQKCLTPVQGPKKGPSSGRGPFRYFSIISSPLYALRLFRRGLRCLLRARLFSRRLRLRLLRRHLRRRGRRGFLLHLRLRVRLRLHRQAHHLRHYRLRILRLRLRTGP